MPAPQCLLLKTYLEKRKFKVRYDNDFSPLYDIKASVPQGSDLFPDLYNIFTMDIPKTNNTILATFTDDTAILSSNNDIITPAHHLLKNVLIFGPMTE